MKKLKIALVYDAIYPYIKGGGERRFYELGTRLAKAGHEVHWYGMKFWDGPKTIERDGIILHGLCKARPLYTKSGRRSIPQALIFGLSSFKLLFIDFDVMDCCGFPYTSLFPAKLATIIRRKPLFATWHEVWGKDYWRDYLGFIGTVGYFVEWLAVKLPSRIIANSEHTADLLEKELKIKKSIVVTNGVDIDKIASIKPAKNQSDLIYAGRLMDFKNVHLIIESLSALKKQGTVLSCTIIGNGPSKNKLQDLAKKLSVTEQLIWLDFLESDEVYAHMKAAKLFVLPSKREGFGLVAIEAIVNGTPVLTANFKGNAAKELIRNGVNGYIFDPTSDKLAVCLKKALQELKSLEKSTLSFVETYSWDNISQKLSEVYAS